LHTQHHLLQGHPLPKVILDSKREEESRKEKREGEREESVREGGKEKEPGEIFSLPSAASERSWQRCPLSPANIATHHEQQNAAMTNKHSPITLFSCFLFSFS
jgi:hypothetical protein